MSNGDKKEKRLPPYAAGSDTSYRAAIRMMAEAKTIRAKVEAVIAMGGKRGKTTEEVEEHLGMKHQTVSARVYELKKSGEVFDSGQRHTNSSGCKAALMVHNRFDNFHPTCPSCGERGDNCDCTWEDQDAAEASTARSAG